MDPPLSDINVAIPSIATFMSLSFHPYKGGVITAPPL